MQFRVAVEQQRDVSLRARCHQRHRLAAVAQHFRHQLNGSAILRFKARFRQRRAIQAAFAVNVIGDDQIAHQRFYRTARHRNIRTFKQR
ncbi:hypothetical protein D3C87_1903810 [compost metagenome]